VINRTVGHSYCWTFSEIEIIYVPEKGNLEKGLILFNNKYGSDPEVIYITLSLSKTALDLPYIVCDVQL